MSEDQERDEEKRADRLPAWVYAIVAGWSPAGTREWLRREARRQLRRGGGGS